MGFLGRQEEQITLGQKDLPISSHAFKAVIVISLYRVTDKEGLLVRRPDTEPFVDGCVRVGRR